jgi:hypothetical protein
MSRFEQTSALGQFRKSEGQVFFWRKRFIMHVSRRSLSDCINRRWISPIEILSERNEKPMATNESQISFGKMLAVFLLAGRLPQLWHFGRW